MPNYNFLCKKCNKVYDDLVAYDEKDKYPTVVCPFCNSKKKTKLMTACNFQFAQPEGTGRWISDAQGHDYRFKHNLPKVLKERQAAEEAGKSPMPYNPINDLNSDTSWGQVN